MKLSTVVNIPANQWKINHNHHILCIGSCFSDNITRYLQNHKFFSFANPCGISYNPLSVLKSLELGIENKIDQDRIVERDGIFNHFDFHGSFGQLTKDDLLDQITKQIRLANEFIQEVDVLILTFGTAYVFENKALDNGLVNNCHKLPNDQFDRRLLSIAEITEESKRILAQLKSINQQLKVVLTVSPIRHLRDGLVNNQISKSTLILACHELCKAIEGISYFPSYEILLDEMRDYRYYKDDLIHPTDLAVNQVITRFVKAYLSDYSLSINDDIAKLNRMMAHRPLYPRSQSHREFNKSILSFIKELIKEYPNLSFEEELKIMKSRLS